MRQWAVADDRYDRLVRTLTEERVAALTRISRTLDALLEQVRALRAALPEEGADARDLAVYRARRAEAMRYRWYLEVQREALGLRHHHRLDEYYDIPGPR
jgi:hypothetical protein